MNEVRTSRGESVLGGTRWRGSMAGCVAVGRTLVRALLLAVAVAGLALAQQPDGVAQDGVAQAGADQGSVTQDGAAQDGVTQDGVPQGGVTDVRLGVGSIVTESPHVSLNDLVVTISAPGTYRLSGQLHNGRLVVRSNEPGAVILLLDGVSVYAATGPALVIKAADQVVLRLAAGSYNNLFDGRERLAGDPGAALFSEAPLVIEGEGHLLVMARLKHGVASESSVVVDGGVLTVSAADDGIRGEDLTVNGGDLLVFSANDALKSTGEDEGSGVVEINGGFIDLVAEGDGVQAERLLVVRGGIMEVFAGGGHTVAPGDASTKGLKADVELIVVGGIVTVDSSDDSVHSDGDIKILGGRLTLATGDDAVHADGSLLVEGGWVEVTASWEGLEASQVTITGGTVLVWADDDGLNAAGDAPASELLLTISGGHLVVSAGSDAVDSNGAVHVTGGTVVLNGPFTFAKPAIDRHLRHTVLLDGATVVAAGTLVLGRASGVDPLSSQAVVYLDFNWWVQEGALLSLRGRDGWVGTFRAPQTLTRMSFTSPLIEAGATYELFLGGDPVGEELLGGVFLPAGVSGAELRREFQAR